MQTPDVYPPGFLNPIAGAMAAPRVPQIPEQLAALEKSITELCNAVDRLAAKLNNVMQAQEKTQPPQGSAPVVTNLCPVASAVAIQVGTIYETIKRLNFMLNNVEL